MTRKILIVLLVFVTSSCRFSSPCEKYQILCPAPTLTSTPSPSVTVRPSPSAAATEPYEVAEVRGITVNVRKTPGGDPTGLYVYSGQAVVILEYSKDGRWARIEAPAGWIFVGCLISESGLLCQAAP